MMRSPGLTLIELMIVVIIIGLLVAFAVPVYINQLTRVRVTEGLELAAPVKTAVAETYSSNGSFPSSNSEAGLNASISSPYVTSISVSNNGVIVIVYHADSGVGANNIIELVPTIPGGSITWICNGAGTTVQDKHLPPKCR